MHPLDVLESRRHFSVTLTRHVLQITGTAGNDAIVVSLKTPTILRVSDNGNVSTVALRNVHAIAVDAGEGNDEVLLSASRGVYDLPATLLGGAGRDRLVGNAGHEVLAGGAGADTLVGNGGHDILRGGSGNDSLDGGSGRDDLAGQGGVDTIVGGAAVDRLHSVDSPGERVDQTAIDIVAQDGVTWAAVNDFTYQLQNVDPAAMGQSKFDLAVIDPYDDNSVARTPSEIADLQHSPGGPKRVLAYLSIGEAEDYRPYWNAAWDANHDGTPDAGAPSWLAAGNPDWPGNYTIRYWDPAWQAIVMQAVDRIVQQGFDGVYLDIVDAFETWGPAGNNQRPTAERDMVEFVQAIAARARQTDGRTDFAVVPQNGEALGQYADYLATVTAIGHEDVFFNGDAANDAGTVSQLVSDLDRFKTAGRPVWVIDYPRKGKNIDAVYAAAKSHGYVAYAPSRALDTLAINVGHEPD